MIRKRIKLSAEQGEPSSRRPAALLLCLYLERVRFFPHHCRVLLSAALWVFVETIENGKKSQVLPPTSHSMASVYHDYKDEDNFLVSIGPASTQTAVVISNLTSSLLSPLVAVFVHRILRSSAPAVHHVQRRERVR